MAERHRRQLALHRTRQADADAYIESFNGRLRDELLNEEVLNSLADARHKLARWRYDYNTVRPHSALNGPSPATTRRALEQFDSSTPSALAKLEPVRYSIQRLSK